MLHLEKVNQANWLDVIRLSSGSDQKNRIFEDFIASNCLSLAQASLSENWTTKAIYDDKTLIGFTMYGYSEELQAYELCRLMIDYHFQGKGYGKKALRQIVEKMQSQYGCSDIIICFMPDNTRAKNLYESFGFKDTGKTIEDELIYSLNV
ncbi:diamine N-acetyltransferase [Mesobacillus persicus]|uniref:Diamine N-acetyltransferase n=1 Tax=Mesobacillus persicus TaxID=930146 RepID=A0A1H7VVF5_9BACI|nr:GNAT family N-acetyltransferase [Mesobacillus persicus]SEM12795.1 diamine N-acetyltransferase [Mesobacillus persicus]